MDVELEKVITCAQQTNASQLCKTFTKCISGCIFILTQELVVVVGVEQLVIGEEVESPGPHDAHGWLRKGGGWRSHVGAPEVVQTRSVLVPGLGRAAGVHGTHSLPGQCSRLEQ